MFLYLVSNESLHSLVKIGVTKDIEKRLDSLSTSNIPSDYMLERCWKLNGNYKYAVQVEKIMHLMLHKYRYSKHKEFFTLAVDKASKLIDNKYSTIKNLSVEELILEIKSLKLKTEIKQQHTDAVSCKFVEPTDMLNKNAYRNLVTFLKTNKLFSGLKAIHDRQNKRITYTIKKKTLLKKLKLTDQEFKELAIHLCSSYSNALKMRFYGVIFQSNKLCLKLTYA